MGRPVVLVFLVDALGWRVCEHFGFARDAFPTRGPLGTVLGYSSAAIPSLLSGTTPSEHGSWSMFRRANAGGSFGFLSRVPRLPHAIEWRARRWVRRWADARSGTRAYYDLYEIPLHLLHRFDLGQKSDPFQPGGLARPTVFDWMREHGLRYRLWYYRSSEEENLAAAEAALAGDADVLFVYTAELDALMHRVGVSHPSVGARLRRYDSFLSSVRREARARDVSLTTILLSDHGMTDVSRTVDPWGALDASGLRLGRDYLAFFDSTMVRVWGDAATLERALALLGAHGRRLSDDELRSLGCWFRAAEYGDAVVLADPGTLVVPSFMGSSAIAAMHGYHPDDAFSHGCLMTDAGAPPPKSLLGFKAFFERVVQEAR